MARIRGAEGENDCRDKEIHVVIVFFNLLKTPTRQPCRDKNKTAASKLCRDIVKVCFATESKKDLKEPVVTKNCMLR